MKNDALLKAALAATDVFVTGPETMAQYYSDVFRIPSHKIMLLYNDIDLDRFHNGGKEPGEELVVLLVHRLSPVRETNRYIPHLVRVLNSFVRRTNRKVRVDIVGDGPERAIIESSLASAEQDVRVKFYGAIPNLEVQRFYRGADLFIMPSYREGFPRVILEAMAMGLPIVATDAGGTRDVFGELQQHFVVGRDDAETFAARVVELLGDSKKRADLSHENLVRVQRFSTTAVAVMYDKRLRFLLNH